MENNLENAISVFKEKHNKITSGANFFKLALGTIQKELENLKVELENFAKNNPDLSEFEQDELFELFAEIELELSLFIEPDENPQNNEPQRQ